MDQVGAEMPGVKLLFMQSSGGLTDAHAFQGKDAILSGPAGGIVGMAGSYGLLRAWGFDSRSGPMELNIPAIKGIGDSLIYLVDRWTGKAGHGGIGDISIYDVDFEPIDTETAETDVAHRGAGLGRGGSHRPLSRTRLRLRA